MSNKLTEIFSKNNKIIIGAIHFAPLLEYAEFPGYKTVFKNAISDLKAFKQGGVDGVIFENNYDIPHTEFVSDKTAEMMLDLGKELKKQSDLPMGINVLWNDYKNALKIAKELNLVFIRIPVFVDEIETRYGKIIGQPNKIISFQKSINAEHVAIFTDIHVKHSKLLSNTTILQAANKAIKNQSNGLIITGEWTGEAPDYDELNQVRSEINDFPIIIGSGANKENINDLFKYADAAIVSTALKEGQNQNDQTDNLKNWSQRIDQKKVTRFIKAIK